MLPLPGPDVTAQELTDKVSALEARVEELERERRLLRESEHWLRMVLDSLPVGIWFTDAVGKIVLGNPAVQRIWGGVRYVGVERYGEYRGWWADTGERIAAEDWAMARGLKGETSLDEVIDIESFDGQCKTILNSCVPVRDEGGAILGALVINLDITLQKQAERRLNDALARLRFHADSSPLAMIEWSEAFRVTAWNVAAERVFGWCAGEAIGRSIAELQLVHAEDLRGVEAVAEDMIRGARPSNVHHTRNICKDGGVIDCEWYNSSFYERSGRLSSVLSMVLDVTGRRRAEARAESLARFPQENPDPILRLSSDATVSYANQAASAKLRGLGVEVGQTAPAQLGVPARQALRDARGIKTEIECGGAVFAISLVPVGDEVNIYGQDITARKRAEEALLAGDRRKTEFLAMLSHELRNPLTPIRNSIHILNQAHASAAQAIRAREVLQRQTEHLTRLVNDLLDTTRASSGKIALQRVRLDLGELVRQVCADYRSMFEREQLGLRVKLPPRALWIEADATRLVQVIGNLLNNAGKFTPAGGQVVVEVGAREGAAEVSVRDNGVGIEPDQVAKMFEPFAQGDNGLARTQGGLGLGLTLVKALVEQHDGVVRAHSEGVGRGAEFMFTLPLPLAAGSEAECGPGPGSGGRPLSVLIVEDNIDAGDSLATILEYEGHQVQVARDGGSAIALVRTLRPDVVLCDIGLPDISGYEVARTLRADASLKATRLIAVSGYAQPEDLERAAEAGFDAHLPKPPPLDQLCALIVAR